MFVIGNWNSVKVKDFKRVYIYIYMYIRKNSIRLFKFYYIDQKSIAMDFEQKFPAIRLINVFIEIKIFPNKWKNLQLFKFYLYWIVSLLKKSKNLPLKCTLERTEWKIVFGVISAIV